MFIELVLDKKIATIIIKNKNKKNSLTKDFFIELKESLEKISNNENIRVLILKGDGDNFSSGVNLNELIQFPSTIDARDFALLMESTFNKLFNLRIPTISVVDGFALGAGAGLVLNTESILL